MPLWFVPVGVLCAPFVALWYIGMFAVWSACALAQWAWDSVWEGH